MFLYQSEEINEETNQVTYPVENRRRHLGDRWSRYWRDWMKQRSRQAVGHALIIFYHVFQGGEVRAVIDEQQVPLY